jgi:hypothetical protein
MFGRAAAVVKCNRVPGGWARLSRRIFSPFAIPGVISLSQISL